jgi:regulator of cell morphogenesis and NO signaling
MTLTITPESTVAEAAVSNPTATRVFESFGIDYCCGGKRTIREASDRAGIPLDVILTSLTNQEGKTASRDWNEASIPELVGHIVDFHHAFVRRESARIESLLAKVVNKHSALRPEVRELHDVFCALAQELSMHMLKEERVLFPVLLGETCATQSCFGSIANPISRMIEEHDDAGDLLVSIRRLTNDFAPPADACPTFVALYQALNEFEQDLHQHIHLENNILFPKALQGN